MPKPLTDLERRVLDYLIDYLRRNTYQPSIREIGREFSIKSTKTVSELLQSLANKGWIERDPSRSRGVRLHGLEMSSHTVAVPLLRDGDNSNAEEFVLDRRLVGEAGVFLFLQSGSHLREYGIWEGDLVLVEPVAQPDVEAGDLLLIRHNNGSEVRRCSRRDADLQLEPGGAGSTPLTVTTRQSTLIQGRVSGVVRRLRPAQQRNVPRAVPVPT